jgi:hypothetical protein
MARGDEMPRRVAPMGSGVAAADPCGRSQDAREVAFTLADTYAGAAALGNRRARALHHAGRDRCSPAARRGVPRGGVSEVADVVTRPADAQGMTAEQSSAFAYAHRAGGETAGYHRGSRAPTRRS